MERASSTLRAGRFRKDRKRLVEKVDGDKIPDKRSRVKTTQTAGTPAKKAKSAGGRGCGKAGKAGKAVKKHECSETKS